MADSKSNSNNSLFQTKHIYYLAPLLAVAIALTIFLPSFLGSPLDLSPATSPQTSEKKDEIELPINITTAVDSIGTRPKEQFSDLKYAFDRWDSEVGCPRFREKFKRWKVNESAVQQTYGQDCSALKLDHVSVWAKAVSWVPNVLDGLYECRCGLSCLWSQSNVLVDQPDVELYQAYGPPETRKTGEPLRAFLELEAWRKPSGHEDIFISYHSSSDVQATYAGKTSSTVTMLPQRREMMHWSTGLRQGAFGTGIKLQNHSSHLYHITPSADASTMLEAMILLYKCTQTVKWKITQFHTGGITSTVPCHTTSSCWPLRTHGQRVMSLRNCSIPWKLGQCQSILVPPMFGTLCPPIQLSMHPSLSQLKSWQSMLRLLQKIPWLMQSSMHGDDVVCWEIIIK